MLHTIRKATISSKKLEQNDASILKVRMDKQVKTLSAILKATNESKAAWKGVVDQALAISHLMVQTHTEGDEELRGLMRSTCSEVKALQANFKGAPFHRAGALRRAG
jgi:hypothetical protein